jgi:four helix bundle protein
MRNFRDLEIWKEAMNFTLVIYQLVKEFPPEEKFGLRSQMTRCAVSIPSNIAEGCRGSNKELIQYLNIALGSSFELETQLEISNKVGYIEKNKCDMSIKNLNRLQKRINAFRNHLKSQTPK